VDYSPEADPNMAHPDPAERRPPGGPDLSGLRIADTARTAGGVRWLRWFAAALGVAVLLLGGIAALRGKAPTVEVVTAHASAPGARATLLNASGYVTPRRRATVAAKITGRVEELHVEEGMRVSEGQVLAVLDSSDARVRLTSAKADRDAQSAALRDLQVNLGNAERELVRTEALVKQGVSTDQALDAARTLVDSLRARIALTNQQVQASEARIKVAQQDLDNTVVRAPFAGIIVSKDAQVGEMVSPISAGGGFTRTGIATLVDMNSIETEVDVNESYIARVKPGMPTTATLDAYPDWQIPSKVRTVIPTADRQKATVKVRITFDKLDPRILPDMGVKVAFLEDAPAAAQPSAAPKITVPSSAVKQDNGSSVVYLYRDGKVERRAVRTGATRGDSQEILAGLNEGDQVVVKSAENLRDGDKVALKQ
jgi:RND family efflux transporter MFP subunit